MKRSSLLVIGLLFATNLLAQTPSERIAAVEKQVAAFSEAFRTADADMLAAMLVEDYIHTNTDGSIIDKERWLRWIRSRHEELANSMLHITRYENSDVVVRLHGDAAVVTGINLSEGTRQGERFRSHLRFTHLWVYVDGTWKRAAFHDTRL